MKFEISRLFRTRKKQSSKKNLSLEIESEQISVYKVYLNKFIMTCKTLWFNKIISVNRCCHAICGIYDVTQERGGKDCRNSVLRYVTADSGVSVITDAHTLNEMKQKWLNINERMQVFINWWNASWKLKYLYSLFQDCLVSFNILFQHIYM